MKVQPIRVYRKENLDPADPRGLKVRRGRKELRAHLDTLVLQVLGAHKGALAIRGTQG
jgi:hypothetical protein